LSAAIDVRGDHLLWRRYMVRFITKFCILVLIAGCADGGLGTGARDLKVTFVTSVDPPQTSCGAYERRTLALEDASGTLLVPATGFTASEVLDNDDPSFPANQVCHYTAVFTDVPDSDVYQLVYSSEGEQYRGGYRQSDLDAVSWDLVGTYDQLIRRRG
jgi:hypothetical protein